MLDIIARDVSFDELMLGICCNCVECIRACICDWECEDETDYINAMIVYKKILDDDDDRLPPRIRKISI